MTRPIGYYVHHQGDGHRQRALAVAQAAGDGHVTLLGTGLAGNTGDVLCVDLPDDRLTARFDGEDAQARPSSLHFAPIDHDGIRRRVAAIGNWIAQTQPALLVVDVSVEVAMLARLASVPTVYVRLSGHRDDLPHLEAFRGAAALMAPFHADLDDDRTPLPIRQKTFYAPGIMPRCDGVPIQAGLILVVVGRGGNAGNGDYWAQVAATVPDRRWRVIGPCTAPAALPPNLELLGWVENAERMIASAAIVIGGAGDGLVGTVIAHRRPFLCLPEQRPFGEQISKAMRLSALGAAIVPAALPTASDWPELVRRAQALDPARLARLDDVAGAERAALWMMRLASHGAMRRSLAV